MLDVQKLRMEFQFKGAEEAEKRAQELSLKRLENDGLARQKELEMQARENERRADERAETIRQERMRDERMAQEANHRHIERLEAEKTAASREENERFYRGLADSAANLVTGVAEVEKENKVEKKKFQMEKMKFGADCGFKFLDVFGQRVDRQEDRLERREIRAEDRRERRQDCADDRRERLENRVDDRQERREVRERDDRERQLDRQERREDRDEDLRERHEVRREDRREHERGMKISAMGFASGMKTMFRLSTPSGRGKTMRRLGNGSEN